MRYRALDASGDMTFGRGGQNFLVDSPDAVAQAVLTRLRLATGEWFLDLTDGTPYATDILGAHTELTRDAAVRERLLDTQGVLSLDSYSSHMTGRTFNVAATLTTIYGETTVEAAL